MKMQKKLENIALGGGCFWCTEAVFDLLAGVKKVTPGYAGGTTAEPSYEQVCGGRTGHAEVVLVEYDPQEVSLEKLLEIFFASHDPTTLNRQGNDVGTQYRSIILYTSEEQKALIEAFIEGIADEYGQPIVTEVKALDRFYQAEDYHQRYFEKNPHQGYCQLVVAPKVKKIKKLVGSDPKDFTRRRLEG
jgi:peptide-methionine (S)-S-oxide reductase